MIDINEFDKDQLADYALTVYKVELDMRKSLDKLRVEVSKMQSKPAAPVVVVVAAPSKPNATHILNRENGRWFPWTELLYKHLTNAVPCDENGKPV